MYFTAMCRALGFPRALPAAGSYSAASSEGTSGGVLSAQLWMGSC
jgi:hypothetical protein